MKTLLAIAIIAATSLTGFAATGKLGPYLNAYSGSPVSAAVSAINPAPGATVIDTVTGLRYDKISPFGDNSLYTTRELIFDSGIITFSGTAVQTLTIATIPAGEKNFIATSANVLCVTGTMTTAPTFVIQSGTGTTLSGTTTLTGLTPNTATKIATADPTPIVDNTAASTLQLRTVTSGTGTITARAFVRGFFLP